METLHCVIHIEIVGVAKTNWHCNYGGGENENKELIFSIVTMPSLKNGKKKKICFLDNNDMMKPINRFHTC